MNMPALALPEIELEDDTEMKDRLTNWMAWCVSRDNHGLGYPSQSPTVRLLPAPSRLGGHIDAKDAWLIERAVNKLPEREKVLIRTHYRFRHLSLRVRLREIARQGYAYQERRYRDLRKAAECMIKNILHTLPKSA